ncbi:MAG TPA: electron transport complex subunit RsxG [Methylotenera sp.]|nr:electron transport complex subunit RsxG [Methylotenera sp.]
MPETIIKHASKTALTLIVFALVFTALLAYIFQITKEPIEKSEATARLALFRQIVPANMHDNDILKDTLTIAPSDLLGNTQSSIANRARINNAPAAIILEAIAHDGYSGDIKLLIAIKYNGEISGVRVLTHKETPGLGDYIDIAKDDWIKLFDAESLTKTSGELAENKWKVKKDGGQFDYMAGATITPRAVVKAVHKALKYFETNKDALFA